MQNILSRFVDVLLGSPRIAAPTNAPKPDSAASGTAPASAVPPVQLDIFEEVASEIPSDEILVGGLPHRYVCEEGVTKFFAPRFESHLVETPFGKKVLPAGVPHWAEVGMFTLELKAAVEKFVETQAAGESRAKVREVGKTESGSGARMSSVNAPTDMGSEVSAGKTKVRPSDAQNSNSQGITIGSVVGWGEEKFPDRKKRGRTYTSFAMRVDSEGSEVVLQGEGLKEAITETKTEVGDRVSVRRVRKIKVPAIDQKSGEPLLDENGDQKLWDKWIWEIKHLK